MSPENRPRTEVITSAATLLDKTTLWSLLFPIEIIDALFRQAGYAGIQWMPLQGCLPAQFQLSHGLVAQATQDRIHSAAQSYRSERNIFASLKHPKWKLALQTLAMLPYRDKSLKDIVRLQNVLGRDIPVVLQPKTGAFDPGTGYAFGERLIQPSPDLMRLWGVSTPEKFIEAAENRGYTGFCFDTTHFREGDSLIAWQVVIPKLLPFIKMVGVSAGRTDVDPKYKIPTMVELVDLIDGTNLTELPSILRFIRDRGWKGPVTIKVPAAGIAQLTLKSGRFLKPKDLINVHSRIVNSVTRLID